MSGVKAKLLQAKTALLGGRREAAFVAIATEVIGEQSEARATLALAETYGLAQG